MRMDQKTLKHIRIRIPNVTRFFFIPTKQSYSKQVEIIKMWKKMGEGEETWASKASLVTLLVIDQKEPNHDNLVEFLNIFVIKGSKIYFGRRGIVYVIGKQIIADAFQVCQSRYVEDPKGQVTKMLDLRWIGHILCSIICVGSWMDGPRCRQRCKQIGNKRT